MELINKAPAKINLSLAALYRHTDGLHEWEMVMASVDLADYVTIKPLSSSKITVTTSSGFLPEDKRNLAYQAARALQRQMKIKRGASIYIDKHIPVAAGLGGGSSDAAAVLRGLNQLWNINLSEAELAKIGLSVDSDVPYCVYSRPALVTGRGEKIKPLGSLPPCWVVLAKPHLSVSTPSILKELDYSQLPSMAVPDTKKIVTGIQQQNFALMLSGMRNVLEPVTMKHYSEIKYMKAQMQKFGADIVQMSGTGPTIFGLCHNYSRAQHVYNSMSGFCSEVYLVRPI